MAPDHGQTQGSHPTTDGVKSKSSRSQSAVMAGTRKSRTINSFSFGCKFTKCLE